MSLNHLVATLQLFHPAGEPQEPQNPEPAIRADAAAFQRKVAELLGLDLLSYRPI
jgi:hypothetical protein